MQFVTGEIKESIYKKVEITSPVYAAMLLKNWKRYAMSVNLFLSSSKPLKTDVILDYGCGFPFVVAILSELGFTVFGYEPYATEQELEIAKMLDIAHVYQTKLQQDVVYDHLLLIDVIEHLSIIKPIMEEIYALVKTKGTLFISTPNVLRFDMWSKFVFRKTGHPQQLEKYLASDNNYKNHQREFTLNELLKTVKYFNFKEIVLSAIKDTQPSIKELNDYHTLLRDNIILKRTITGAIQNTILKFFPASFRNNNLFVCARKM